MNKTITYTYDAKYRKFANWTIVPQPILTVQLILGQKVFEGDALLDSGADWVTFNLEIAEFLGVDTKKLKHSTVFGVGGKLNAFVVDRMWLKFGPLTKPIECQVRFIAGLPQNLIGRSGAFSHFQINFDEADQTIHMALNATTSEVRI